MGLIRQFLKDAGNTVKDAGGALLGAFNGVLGQAAFQEYFVSGNMSGDILMKRAEQVKKNGSFNKNSDANIISDGSLIDVQEQQCAIIIEDGKIVEACMEPGRFIYQTSAAPSFFAGQGKFGERFVNVAKEMWEQAKIGGMRRHTQRIYYINMGVLDKAILWGVGNVSFKHTQRFAGMPAPLVMTVHVKGHGTARVRIERPLEFYSLYGAKYAGGDNMTEITIDSLDTFFENTRQKMSQAVSSAMAELGKAQEVAYDEIMVGDHLAYMIKKVDENLMNTDIYKIGFSCYDFTVGGSGLTISDEDADLITQRQNQMMMLANGAAGYDIQTQMAQGFAKGAEKGGMENMMGMGMLMGGPMGAFGNMGNVQGQPAFNPAYANNGVPQQHVMGAAVVGAAAASNSWTCECGATVEGGANFCPKCGKKKPAPQPVATDASWTCECGTVNSGNFCMKCGKKRPAAGRKLVCDKCGWTGILDPGVKFCPNCGDPINENDIK